MRPKNPFFSDRKKADDFSRNIKKQVRDVEEGYNSAMRGWRNTQRQSSFSGPEPYRPTDKIASIHDKVWAKKDKAWGSLLRSRDKYRQARASGDKTAEARHIKSFQRHAKTIRQADSDLAQFQKRYGLTKSRAQIRKEETERAAKAKADFDKSPLGKKIARERKMQMTFDKAMQGKHVKEAPAWVQTRLMENEYRRRQGMDPQNAGLDVRAAAKEHGSKSFKLIRNLDFRYSESRAKMHEAKLRVREARRTGNKQMEKEELNKFRFHTKEAKENYNGYYAARQVYGWKKTEKVRRAFVDGDPNKAIYERRHGKR